MLGQGQINFDHQPQPTKQQEKEKTDQDAVNEGHEEAVKEEVKQQEVQTQKFEETVHQGTHVLYKASNVFPFDLFPDDISVDVNQVNVFIRHFFWSESRYSILIKDISDVLIVTVPFFASIQIVDFGFRENAVQISFLWKKDAIRLRRIIQGLMVATKQGIDLSQIDKDTLPEKIEELGKVTEVE